MCDEVTAIVEARTDEPPLVALSWVGYLALALAGEESLRVPFGCVVPYSLGGGRFGEIQKSPSEGRWEKVRTEAKRTGRVQQRVSLAQWVSGGEGRKGVAHKQPKARVGKKRKLTVGEGEWVPRAPCGGLPSGAIFHPFQGGGWCNTGPNVPSNPMLDPNYRRAKGKTHDGSTPLVMGPQAGPCFIPFRGGMGTGPHVPSNPMHDPVAPRAKDTTNRGSAPLVMGPQAGPYSIHSRGGGVQYGPPCAL